MFRRFASAPARVSSPNVAATTRAYTDYHHHNYPHITQVYWGMPGFMLVTGIFFVSCGSVWWESNRQTKSDTLRGWRRLLGTGYKWSDEFGPQRETIFCNLPDRAE